MARFIECFSFDEKDAPKMLIDTKAVLHDMGFMTTDTWDSGSYQRASKMIQYTVKEITNESIRFSSGSGSICFGRLQPVAAEFPAACRQGSVRFCSG